MRMRIISPLMGQICCDTAILAVKSRFCSAKTCHIVRILLDFSASLPFTPLPSVKCASLVSFLRDEVTAYFSSLQHAKDSVRG